MKVNASDRLSSLSICMFVCFHSIALGNKKTRAIFSFSVRSGFGCVSSNPPQNWSRPHPITGTFTGPAYLSIYFALNFF